MMNMEFFKVVIQDDIAGTETYYCVAYEAVEELVFGIFTDWIRGEDTIEEIDSHLRENCVGYIEVEKIEMIFPTTV